MPILVTSASGANGNGYGALLAFDDDGKPLGPFSDDDRIIDPRGLAPDPQQGLLFLNSAERVLALDAVGKVVGDTGVIAGLNPGGGIFGPDGRYYVGLRDARTLLALPPNLKSVGEHVLPPGVVPFPRGFGFNAEGTLFLSSGVGPDGKGDETVVAFSSDRTRAVRLVEDPQLSPLDLTVGPNGNVVVSRERPFGALNAVTTIREYDPESGRLVRVFSASRLASFRRPRGLRFGADGHLYCATQDEVVAFDFTTGRCLGAVVRLARLYGQALAFFPP